MGQEGRDADGGQDLAAEEAAGGLLGEVFVGGRGFFGGVGAGVDAHGRVHREERDRHVGPGEDAGDVAADGRDVADLVRRDAAADFVHGPAGGAVALDVGEGGGRADDVAAVLRADAGKAEAGDVHRRDGGVVLHEMEGGAAGEDHAAGAEVAQLAVGRGQRGGPQEFT